MRIIQEDDKLGTAKVIWQFSQEPDPFKTEEPIPANPVSDDADAPVIERETAPLPEPEAKVEEVQSVHIENTAEETAIAPDHLTDMRQMIQFLQQVVESQNQQLKTKDELIRNFQVLLKSEQDQVLKLEARVVDKTQEETKQQAERNWFQTIKRKLLKQ